MLNQWYKQFERFLGIILLFMISIVALSSVIELAYILYKDITNEHGFLFEINELFEVFGMFMLVLIAIELMSSIHIYLENKAFHIEIMFLIAITAVTRKIMILDSKAVEPLYIIAIALLLLSLSLGYFLIKKSTTLTKDCELIPSKKT
jgi:uncharacterized membrane protein (DUF373 family)